MTKLLLCITAGSLDVSSRQMSCVWWRYQSGVGVREVVESNLSESVIISMSPLGNKSHLCHLPYPRTLMLSSYSIPFPTTRGGERKDSCLQVPLWFMLFLSTRDWSETEKRKTRTPDLSVDSPLHFPFIQSRYEQQCTHLLELSSSIAHTIHTSNTT